MVTTEEKKSTEWEVRVGMHVCSNCFYRGTDVTGAWHPYKLEAVFFYECPKCKAEREKAELKKQKEV